MHRMYFRISHSNIMCSLFWMMKYTGGYNSGVNFTVVLHRIIPKLKWYVIFCIDMNDMSSTPTQVIASHLSSSSITFYVMYRFHRICNASSFALICAHVLHLNRSHIPPISAFMFQFHPIIVNSRNTFQLHTSPPLIAQLYWFVFLVFICQQTNTKDM